MRELSELHSRRLLVDFESDEAKQERDIDIATQEITELFRHAEGVLAYFSNKKNNTNLSSSEIVIQGNIQHTMARKLQGLSMTFRSTQKV